MKHHAVGLITARGGSKGIPGKNIRTLAGKPLIAWTIEAALSSNLDRVIVSTEDKEIAQISQKWGAEVPFLRPPELARDDSPHISTVLHAIRWLEQENCWPDYFVLLQPTSPLRTYQDINAALCLLENKNADAVVSLTPAQKHPYLFKMIDEQGQIRDFLEVPQGYLARQKLPTVYVLNGAIYFFRRSTILEKGTWFTEKTIAYLMPPERSIDIDSMWDFHLADLILRGNIGHEGSSDC